MHQLLPPFVLEHLKQNSLSGRFTASSLFADISGFTAITEALMQHGQHGAEVLADVMRTIFDPLVHGVYSQGGFIAFFAGDAFTALFPDEPDASPGASLSDWRAVAAAWQIHQHMLAHAEHVTPYGTFTFAVKVGVAAGQVEWGILRSSDGQRHAFYFSGEAVDSCAQSEHAACGDDVILSSNVYDAVQSQVTAEPCGEYWGVKALDGPWPTPQDASLPQVGPQEMVAFFPPQIVHQRLHGEFRQVITAFVNLRDIQTHGQLDTVMQYVFDLQQRYAGLLTRIDFGDKGCTLVLLWGAPVSFENDVERALNLALDLLAVAPRALRAGITQHIAYVGFSGSALQEEYTCFGQGVNLAARMMTAASWGSIWLGEAAARRAKRLFEIEPLGSHAFRGFAESQPTFEVRGRRTSPPRRFYQGRMVGRQPELAHLHEFVQPLWEGRFAGAVIVYGEAGIGKSRLLHEFHRDCQQGRGLALTWCLCQTNEVLRESLNPFRYWLRAHLEQSASPDETSADRQTRFDRKLEVLIARTPDPALQAELERTRSFLGALIDLHWPGSLYEQLGPQLRFGNTLEALKALLKAESLRQPVILHLEDIQWLDADSQQCLLHLTRDIADYPIAILCTSRYPDHYPLPGLSDGLFAPETPQMVLDLQKLSEAEVAELAVDTLGSPVAPSLLSLLDERAEGNPFFVEQLVLYLREQNLLAKGFQGLEPVTAGVLLPNDVRSVLSARIDRLSQDVKQVVQTAAVLGREFDLSVLSEMIQDDPDLLVKVRFAEEQVIWSALSEIHYIFKHTLLRDAAYDMQSRSQLRESHHLAAGAIEHVARQNGTLPAHCVDLAHHYGQAGDTEHERYYARLAGEQAAARYANSEAVRYLNRALELTPEANPFTRYAILSAEERVYDVTGARDIQLKTIEAMQALADALGQDHVRVAVTLCRANHAIVTGNFAAAVTALQNGIRLAQAIHDTRAEAEGYLHWGRALFFLGDYSAALLRYEHALTLARSAQLRQVEANALHNLGVVSDGQSYYARAIHYYEQSLGIFLEIGDRRGEGTTFNNLGFIANDLGDYVGALAHLEQALRIEREIGDRWGEAQTLNNLGLTHRHRGEYALALDCIRQALSIYRETSDQRGISYALVHLGMVLADLGDYDEAGDCYEQSLNTFRQIGNKRGIGVTLRHFGSLAHQQGNHELARVYSQQALDVIRELGDQHIQAYLLKNLGHAWEGLGDLEQAKAAFQQALTLRRKLKQEYLIPELIAGLARIALARQDAIQALAHAEEILAYLQNYALKGADEPICVYLTCYDILVERQDPRAQDILETAYHLLQERSAQINDDAQRHSFLENVKAHHAVIEAWTRTTSPAR